MRPEDSGKGNCRHGGRPQPTAARPRRPKARKTGAPTIKPTARQFASLRRIPSSMYRPRAYHGCRGTLACACAPSSRARRTSQGANGAFQDRTNGHQAAADTISDAPARNHHTIRRRIRRKMLQGRTNATIVQPSIHSGRPATLPSATAMWRSSKALLPPRIMSIEKQDNHQLVRRTTSAAPPCTPSTTSVIPMGCEKEPPSFRSSLPSKAQIELEMRPVSSR